MTELRAIDVDQWPRREHFEHYRHRVPCAYEVTVAIDVTAFVERVRATGRRTYASQLWAIATVVNRHDEFRMQLLEDGSPPCGTASTRCSPCSTRTPRRSPPWSCSTTRTSGPSTMPQCRRSRRHRDDTRMFPQDDRPGNVFDVSTLPGASFTGFSLQVRDGWDHLLPIITLGGYRTAGDRTLLPWRCTSTTPLPTASTRPGCCASSRSSSPTLAGSADPARPRTASPTLTP
ncbi:CatA-like O-acetyltransferase [Curtobacterium flaccumfaciens]|nr:CatA-like O-acetyltransferase [Curtobacterium flaccumfaciens]